MPLPARARALEAFAGRFGGEPDLIARAPGRVNLIGEHVDYSEGFVLPAAIDLDVVVMLRGRKDRRVLALAADLDAEVEFPVDAPFARTGGWPDYLRGVAVVLGEAGVPISGADLVLAGDVPVGAGLSSSAALEVACATAFLGRAGRHLPGELLARLCRRAEVECAGVACGIMDQFTAVMGRAGHALLLDCRSLEWTAVPVPEDARLLVADSGVRRALQHSAFNDRFRECAEAAERLGVPALRDVPPAWLAQLDGLLEEPLRRRTRHVVNEIERTRRAAERLGAGDLAAVGALMNDSHQGLRDDYQVSTPELDALVEAARAVPGVFGSRLSGAGFGGCTLSLVAAGAVSAFRDRVPAAYRRATGREATVYVCRASDGATTTVRGER